MTQKQPLFIQALLPLIALAVAAFFSLFYWNAGMLMPLMISLIVTSVLGVLLGHKWSDLESYMGKGIQRALPAVYILIIVGIIIGSWISSGVIPTLSIMVLILFILLFLFRVWPLLLVFFLWHLAARSLRSEQSD